MGKKKEKSTVEKVVEMQKQAGPPKIEPPTIESTPIKLWKDEQGKDRYVMDPSIQENGINPLNFVVGVKDFDLARHILTRGVIAVKTSTSSSEDKLNVILQSLNDMKPKDSVEASLITKATALYSQGMSYLSKLEDAKCLEHMQCYGNLATKLLRLHNETIEALSRYRRGGEQRVIVQHQQINLSDQAKAVVGQFPV